METENQGGKLQRFVAHLTADRSGDAQRHDRTLRILIGTFAVFLPIICVAGRWIFESHKFQTSISAYYHTNMRDFFVSGMLFVGLYLIVYAGKKWYDTWLSTSAGILAMGIGFFPNNPGTEGECLIGVFQRTCDISNSLHLISAVLFFAILIVFALFIFTKTDQKQRDANGVLFHDGRSRNKRIRNGIFILSGITMISTAIILVVVRISDPEDFKNGYYVFGGETVMLWAFGLSWLTKAEIWLRD